MQHKISNGKSKYLKGKNYRIRPLKSGEWQIEIRSTEYGYETKRLPVGTNTGDAHKHARKMLIDMANADVHELARKVLKTFTLKKLIDTYLKAATISDRDRRNLTSFQKHEPALCMKTLDQHRMIVTGLENHIVRRNKEVEVDYSITRTLSPLRTMYSNAGKQRLYGLLDDKITLKNPFDEIDLPDDTSGREHCLKPFGELKIFKATHAQCKSSIQRLKWTTLVNMALVTCLRKGVLLRLKWRDVDWQNKWITVSKTYWGKGKRAPEYVPITKKLADVLLSYYESLPDRDKAPDTCIFESMKSRRNRRYSIEYTPLKNSWVDLGWRAIIKRTDLWEPKKGRDGEIRYTKDGKMVRDWFCFHDLRHTAESRYAVKPYGLFPHEYGYLMGHLGDETKIQKKYNHSQKEFCDEIREKIDRGDTILAGTLQKPGGDIPEPHQIAYNRYVVKAVQEWLKTHRDQLIQAHGAEYAANVEAYFKRASTSFPDTELFLQAKAKADDFNQPRENYKRKYKVYPEDDIVMQAWEASNGTGPVNADRARAYLKCQVQSVRYEKEKELRDHFGIDATPFNRE